MSGVLTGAALAAVVLLAVGLFAVWRGPTVFDRLVSVAQTTACTLVLLVVLGFLSGRPSLYLDAALTYALLAVALPIALSVYVERSRPPSDGDEPGEERP